MNNTEMENENQLGRLRPEIKAEIIQLLDSWPSDKPFCLDDVLDIVEEKTGYRPEDGMGFLQASRNRILLNAYKRAMSKNGSKLINRKGKIKAPVKSKIIDALDAWPEDKSLDKIDVIDLVEEHGGHRYRSADFLYSDCHKDLFQAFLINKKRVGKSYRKSRLTPPQIVTIVDTLKNWPDDKPVTIKIVIALIKDLCGYEFRDNSFIHSGANEDILEAYRSARERVDNAGKAKKAKIANLTPEDRTKIVELIDAWPDDEYVSIEKINDLIEMNFGIRYKDITFIYTEANSKIFKAYKRAVERTKSRSLAKLNKKQRKKIAILIDRWPDDKQITHEDITNLIFEKFGIQYRKEFTSIYSPHMKVIKDAYQRARRRYRVNRILTSTRTKSAQKITFEQLSDIIAVKLETQGKTNNLIKNHVSAFKIFVEKGYGRQMTDIIEPSFAGFINFKKTATADAKRIWGNRYWKQKKSCVKKFYAEYRKTVALHEMGETLPERLKYFLMMMDRPLAQVMRMAGYDESKYHSTVWNWIESGKRSGHSRPTLKTYPILEKLDKVLEADGALIETIDTSFLKGAINKIKTEIVPSDQKMKNRFRQAHQYRLAYEKFPDRLKSEVDAYFRFHLDDAPPEGMDRDRANMWESEHSKKTALRRLEYFFGFLVLPKGAENSFGQGMGLSTDQLSLILLTDPFLLRAYMDFRKNRSNFGFDNAGEKVRIGKPYFSTDLLHYLVMGITLLKDDGYLGQPDQGLLDELNGNQRQSPYKFPQMYLDKVRALNKKVTRKTSYLEYANYAKRKIRKLLNSNFVQGRDPEEPIYDLLYLENKKEIVGKYLKRALVKIWNHLEHWRKADPFFPNVDDLKWARRYMVVAFLSTNPHRRELYRTMRIGKELVKKDKRWHLRFKKTVIKNGKYKEIDHSIPIAEWLQEKIDIFIKTYRPHMVGGGQTNGQFDCDYFFRPIIFNWRLQKSGIITEAVSNHVIYTDCRLATMINIEIEGFTGCGPHALRHLIATFVEAITENMQTTADVIGDTVATTGARYVHRRQQEGMLKYNAIQDEIFGTEASASSKMPNTSQTDSIALEANEKLKNQFDKQLSQEKKRVEDLENKLEAEKAENLKVQQKLKDEIQNLTRNCR